jgi:ECF transporter S component (folate family)
MQPNKKISVRILANVALLIALDVILTRQLSINTAIVRIGFGFVPVAICAMMYGPVFAASAAAAGDFIGAILFPTGLYFPGFTVSAALTGLVFGAFLYQNKWKSTGKGNTVRIACAVSLNCLWISLIITTCWLAFLWGDAFIVLLPSRIIQNAIMLPLQFAALHLLQKFVSTLKRRFRFS